MTKYFMEIKFGNKCTNVYESGSLVLKFLISFNHKTHQLNPFLFGHLNVLRSLAVSATDNVRVHVLNMQRACCSTKKGTIKFQENEKKRK